jgi:SAM-dependent methyltransferase
MAATAMSDEPDASQEIASGDLASLRWAFGWQEDWYRGHYPDIDAACRRGQFADGFQHFLRYGLREGRFPSADAARTAARSGRRPSWHHRLGHFLVPLDWPVRGEPATEFVTRLTNGFFDAFLAGPVIIDVGYRGGDAAAVPILPHAVGIDIGDPGYDGIHLPFGDATVNSIFASHVLEHIDEYRAAICEWHRNLKPGGFIVCIVPHQFLYEKRRELPSRWNADHRRFYTPASLLREFEESLLPNTYRIRHLRDNDTGYLYAIGPERHATGCYEIELVIEKIAAPEWELC